MSENIARTPSEGLEHRLIELGALRNAGTRSPSFRAWRQATLTLLQRIWSGDPGVSERFRRIPFSPNHARADTTELRNVYERGCAEAATYLKELRDRIGDQEWAEVERSGYSESFEVGSTEDDFPTLDLPPGNGQRSGSRPSRSKSKNRGARPSPRRADLGDLLKEAESKGTRSGAPKLPMAESRVIPPEDEAPSSKQKGRRLSPGTRKTMDRLKDMLGFGEAPAAPAPSPPTASTPDAPPPVVAIPPVLSAPLAAPPPAAAAVTPPVPPVVPTDLLREFETPVPPAAAAPPPQVPPAAPTLKDMLMTPDFTARLESSIDPDLWSSPSVPGPEELAQGLPPEADPDGATEEFFRNSPVLSSMGSPVRRRETPEPRSGYLVPEAIEILEISGRAAEFGVPEGRRAHARAYLAELARQLENQDLSWNTLRDSIQFLMEFPPLARRVLPLLLPFLDQAA